MDPSYLTTPATGFGPAEWVFMIASVLVAAGGIYFAFLRSDSVARRAAALRQLGYGMAIVGVVGVIVGGVRLAGTGLPPYMFTIVTVVYVALAAYAAYFALVVYPRQAAAGTPSGRPRPSPARATPQRVASTESRPASNGVPRTPATTGRRESRRDRKRSKGK